MQLKVIMEVLKILANINKYIWHKQYKCELNLLSYFFLIKIYRHPS